MPAINTVTARPDQVPIDLALQEAGSIEAMFDVAALNGVSVTDDLTAGGVYIKPSVIDNKTTTLFKGNNVLASMGVVPASQFVPGEQGIEFWSIGNDFIIS